MEEKIGRLAGLKIAVDFTPLLPGGENGGAKVLTIELVRSLACLLPKTSFLLLTSETSHSELDLLESENPNIQRICVLHANHSITKAVFVPNWRVRVLNRLKILASRWLPLVIKRYIKRYQRCLFPVSSSAGFLHQMGINILFCPFTAPFFADKNISTVSVVYDLQYRAYPQFFSPEELTQRESTFLEACNKADYLVTISDFVKKTVLEASRLPSEKVTTVHIGLLRIQAQSSDTASFTSLLEKYDLRRNEFLLYPANFWRHKNHAMLLTAFGIYRQANPASKMKLVFTGAPGTGTEILCDAARRMGLADWVVYPGYVSSVEYEGLLKSAFGLIFPSLYEGFGIPVIEAMAAGVPVLCSNITSLPEVGGDAVIYFDPRKPDQIVAAINRLIDEPGLRESLVSRGYQRLPQFKDINYMAQQYADIFTQVVKSDYAKSYSITGVYPDGWTGESICIEYPETNPGSDRVVSLTLKNPRWRLSPVSVILNSGVDHETKRKVKIEPGEIVCLETKLSDAGDMSIFTFNPIFCPMDKGESADNRKLGLRCLRCEIVNSTGSSVLLVEN